MASFWGGSSFAAQNVKISFDQYHGYNGTENYINKVAQTYPNITKLIEIGKSNMGRPIHVLVISNMNNGTTIDKYVKLTNKRKEGVNNVTPMESYQGKPGHWICGAVHGNEYTGTEVCLYIIDNLVSGYGSDNEITKLIDTKTFYICPMVNPDGVYNSIERGLSQRSNSEMKDNDGDGKINEDGPDDLNKDGSITQFRYKDPKGEYVIDDEDPRLMVRLGSDETSAKQKYSVIREDKDNDGDGKYSEDSESGIDLNRNFPEGWFQDNGMAGGSGDFPTSAPESRAVVEFLTNHRNVYMAQFYHTSGGFTYRPMGTAPHSQMHAKDVAVFDFILGKKYLEIIGEEVPEAWQKPDSLAKFKEELKKTSKNKYAIDRGYVLPHGWRVSYDEERDRRYSYGMAADWAYKQYGTYSLCIELWNPAKDIPNFPEIEGDETRLKTQRALLKYQDEKHGGIYFVPWKRYKHPEFGEGEIGGWKSQYSGGNAYPGEPLLKVCENHWQYELFRAGLLPEVEIKDTRTNVLYTTDNVSGATVTQKGDQITVKKGLSQGKYKIVEVTVNIENTGKLATHVAEGSQLAGLREDVVWLIGDHKKITFLQGDPFQKLGVLEGQMEIPAYKDMANSEQGQQRMQQRRPGYPEGSDRLEDENRQPQKGPKREIKWVIAVEGAAPLTVVVTSQKGGTKVKNLTIQ